MMSRSLQVLSFRPGLPGMVNRHAEILIPSARSAGKPEGGSSWCSSRVCTAHSIPIPGLCYGLTKAGESTAVALTTPSWKGIPGFTTTVRLTVQGDPPPHVAGVGPTS